MSESLIKKHLQKPMPINLTKKNNKITQLRKIVGLLGVAGVVSFLAELSCCSFLLDLSALAFVNASLSTILTTKANADKSNKKEQQDNSAKKETTPATPSKPTTPLPDSLDASFSFSTLGDCLLSSFWLSCFCDSFSTGGVVIPCQNR
jgi:hypothetical protein